MPEPLKVTPEIAEKLAAIRQKYDVMGQDYLAYLDGLLHAEVLDYWNYIHLDTLLSLQTPRTPIPDERIFIVYHQITELYFQLCLQAIEQLQDAGTELSLDLLKRQLRRLIRYFEQLSSSFDIMIEGMDRAEFLEFRMALLPASGFQSVQFRRIELLSTDALNLVHHKSRTGYSLQTDPGEYWTDLYWKQGGLELATGKKTLTLRRFEKRYSNGLLQLARSNRHTNVRQLAQPFVDAGDTELIELLRRYDALATVEWPLAHFRSAARYLNRKPDVIEATGGTNWQQYLPPRFKRITFFPDLWSEEEIANWGTGRRPENA